MWDSISSIAHISSVSFEVGKFLGYKIVTFLDFMKAGNYIPDLNWICTCTLCCLVYELRLKGLPYERPISIWERASFYINDVALVSSLLPLSRFHAGASIFNSK